MPQQKPILPPPAIAIEPQVGKVVANPKHWYQSRVMWFNVFVIGASLATTATPALEQHVSPETYGLITAVVGVVNAVLRLVTSRPIVTPDKSFLPPIEGANSE